MARALRLGMRASLLVLSVLAVAGSVNLLAAPARALESSASPTATASSQGGQDGVGEGHDATVLLFHPVDADEVDPFGVPFEGGDPFSVRYQALTAQTGSFAFPVFVADGVGATQGLPNTTRPYQATLDAYEAAFLARHTTSPFALTLTARSAGGRATLDLRVDPLSSIQESQGQRLHLRVALAEDPVHYQPPAPVSNGVVDHRFTVRAYEDAGPVLLSSPTNRTVTIPLDPAWQTDHLLAAAWIQADGTPGRFAPTEVLQATHAALDGPAVRQADKGVLLEAYSATWCTECLYGDLAVEQMAIQHAGAHELKAAPATYLEAPSHPALAILAAIGVAAAIAWLPRGGKHL